MKRHILVCSFFAAVCLVIISCKPENKPEEKQEHVSSTDTNISRQYTCVPFEVDNGWGYDILVDTTKYVHQEHIPAINGLHPFATETDAYNTGALVIKKLEAGIVPPTLTVEEMMAIGIVIPL